MKNQLDRLTALEQTLVPKPAVLAGWTDFPRGYTGEKYLLSETDGWHVWSQYPPGSNLGWQGLRAPEAAAL